MSAGPNSQPLDYGTAERKLQECARRIYEAEKDLERRLTAKADAQSDHRKSLSTAYLHRRSEGRPVSESELMAKADAADAERAYLIADGLAKSAIEALEGRRGDRASLHRLVEWSMKVNAHAEQRQPEGELETIGRRAA